MACINPNTPEFKAALEKAGGNPMLAEIELSKSLEIKPGVAELFESNETLANVVYEALGFRQKQYASKLKEISERRKLVTKEDLQKSQLIKNIRVDKTQPNDLKPNEADKNLASIMLYGHRYSDLSDRDYINDNLSTITNPAEMQSEAEVLAYRILNDLLFDIKVINEFYEEIKENPEYLAALSTNENPVKEFFENDIFEQVEKDKFQITPQQKQQAQQLYSSYLDTIFPDSKVKDIVYHGTDQKLEKFSKDFIGKNENVLGVNGINVAVNKENAENYARNKNFQKISEGLHSLIINVKNPILVESGEKPFEKLYQLDRQFFNNNYNNAKNLSSKEVTEQLINKNFDSVYNKMNDWQSSYVVFEPEQIHILGSKQDIENFARFVKNSDLGNVRDMENYMNSKSLDYIIDKLIQSGKIEKRC